MTRKKDPAETRVPQPHDRLPAFEPVPVKRRAGGWTPERQRAFVAALAETGNVSRAASTVHMTPESAYWLRRRPAAESFRRAWEAALSGAAAAPMRDVAMARAIEGELVPVFERGRLIGLQRVRDDRLLMQILRLHGRDAEGGRIVETQFVRKKPSEGG